jgi:hypothetical protein
MLLWRRANATAANSLADWHREANSVVPIEASTR